MTSSRRRFVAALAFAGTALVAACSGESDEADAPPAAVIRIEASGVSYIGWPEMDVMVNGEKVAALTVDSAKRTIYEVDVPAAQTPVTEIELRITNAVETIDYNYSLGQRQKTITVRGVQLNDEALGAGEPSGDGNLATLLRNNNGGITWHVGQ